MGLIRFDHVSKVFPNGFIGLDDVSFMVDPGSFTYIVGESGAGKTTLMRLLIRELTPTNGTIFLDDQDVTQLPAKHLPKYRRKVGVVFQDYKLVPEKNVFENIAVGLEILGVKRKEISQQVQEMLEVVGLPEKTLMFPTQLSGGELQRIAIARALAMTPAVLFADEPTGNLDPDTSKGIIELLRKVQSMGTTVLVATHDQVVLDAYPARKLHMRQGKLVNDSGAVKEEKKDKKKPAKEEKVAEPEKEMA